MGLRSPAAWDMGCRYGALLSRASGWASFQQCLSIAIFSLPTSSSPILLSGALPGPALH